MIIFKFSIYKICKTNQPHACLYSKALIQLRRFLWISKNVLHMNYLYILKIEETIKSSF